MPKESSSPSEKGFNKASIGGEPPTNNVSALSLSNNLIRQVRRRRFTALLWTFVTALTAANIASLVHQRHGLFASERERTLQATRITTAAFAEETEQMFRQVDQALRGLRAFRRRSQSLPATEAFIDELRLGGARIENAYLVDKEGRLVITHDPATVGRSVADRDYFRFHQATSEDLPFLAPVEFGRATQQHLFRVTRRIDDAQGRFAGVALVTVQPRAISSFYQRLMPEPGSVATLVGTRDQMVRARTPAPPADAWSRPLISPIWDKLREAPTGTYMSDSAIDGVRRHYVYQSIPDWQVVLITGVDEAQIRARADERANQLTLSSGIFNALLIGFAIVLTYIDRQRKRLNHLSLQQAVMLDNDLVGIVKIKDRIGVWENRALERMFGYEPGELRDKPARLLYPDDESHRALGQAAYPVLVKGGTYRTQLVLRRKDGSPIWVDMSGAMVSDESNESMWMMLDITEMKVRQHEVEALAFHDALTGLPNRSLLADRLRQAIPLAERLNTKLAICYIDLDGFKVVNDTFGHAAGDRLLQTIANRLQDCMRGNDTVARLGGDEFVLLLTHLKSEEECAQVLERVLDLIQMPVELGSGGIGQVSASIGVAFFPGHSQDADLLMKLADDAMYQAKRAGKNAIRYAKRIPSKETGQ